MEISEKKRIAWIDIAKGIAILCTIVGHCIGKNKIGIFIFSFHMPLFFVLSGYTLKKTAVADIPRATAKDFRRLYVPAVAVVLVDVLLRAAKAFFFKRGEFPSVPGTFLSVLWGNCNGIKSIRGVGFAWFLVTLFYAKLLFRLVLAKIETYRAVILLALAYLFSLPGLRASLPQGFDLIFGAAFFIDMGFFMKNAHEIPGEKKAALGVAAGFAWLYLISAHGTFVDFAQRKYEAAAILAAVCASVCVMQISQGIETVRVLKVPLAFVGRHSLLLLCIHTLDGHLARLWTFLSIPEIASAPSLAPYIHVLNVAVRCTSRIAVDVFVLVVIVCVRNAIGRTDAFVRRRFHHRSQRHEAPTSLHGAGQMPAD